MGNLNMKKNISQLLFVILMIFSASCINLKDATKTDGSTTTKETAKADTETTTTTEEKNKANTTTEKETTEGTKKADTTTDDKTTEETKKADTTTDVKTTEKTKTNNKIKANANAPKFDRKKLLEQIKELKDKDIDFENTEVLPELKEKMAKFACIGRMKEVISFMSKSEQMAILGAYQAQVEKTEVSGKKNPRCFQPKVLHFVFRQLNRGYIRSINKRMSSDSKKIRKSFQCVKDTFKELKIKTKVQPEINSFVVMQRNVNQCKATFMKSLKHVLGKRRRYLLLKDTDTKSTSITNEAGDVVGFKWLKTEAVTITRSFIRFANCYSALPETMVKSFSNIVYKLAGSEQCAATKTETSFTQLEDDEKKTETTTTTETKPETKDETKPKTETKPETKDETKPKTEAKDETKPKTE